MRTIIKKSMIAGIAGVAILSAAACGSDDADSAATEGPLAGDCALAMLPTAGASNAITMYTGFKDPSKLVIAEGSTDEGATSQVESIKNAELKSLAIDAIASNKKFNAATTIKAKNEVLKGLHTTATKVVEICSDQVSDDNLDYYKTVVDTYSTDIVVPEGGDTSIVPPSTSTTTPRPTTTTPPTNTLKLGDSVVTEYTDSLDKKKLFLDFAVTKVEKAPDSDIKLFKEDLQKQIGALYYVHSTITNGSESVPSGISPRFDSSTSNGSTSGPLIAFGTVESCKNGYDGDVRTLCSMIVLTDKNAKLTEVGIRGLGSDTSGDDMKYIWQVTK